MLLQQRRSCRVIAEIEDIIGIPAADAVRCSAKTGDGVIDVIEAVVTRIPPPRGDPSAPLKALIIDSPVARWTRRAAGLIIGRCT